MKILIDADACPVVDIVIKEATKKKIPIQIYRSYDHFTMQEFPKGVETIYVDAGSDAVDYKIMSELDAEDILITQDYGLAALALEKKAFVLHHTGYTYTKEKIDQLLQFRHISAKARKAGFKTKGPKALTKDQKDMFRKIFIEQITH
ncbi:YaiI/YqxD family protein [Saliterribacillus persicus]|uniref:UPF0178 protein DFR57_11618 n=1 Tax=Saliterribacillus persicus TaxID=930114 RepID=A0A368X7S3_9BACI|nr:YaiI/YqxD family protein [Saliterribacillus persicus]RCW63739.1 hypothetical protein DFR57_11618 [Saliterribacillus persicus]